MTPRTAILVPVLGRPWRVEPLLDSIATATPEPHDVLFLADHDDAAELEALEAAGADVLIVPPPATNYAAKINAGYRATETPLLFLAADDLEFRPEWLSRAIGYLNDSIDVVGTNDLCNERTMTGIHSTHTLVRRSYVETFGTIDEPDTVLHEGYPHEFCDDEFVETAKARGRYAHGFDVLVEHLHPIARKGVPDDATYRRGRARTQVARRLFRQRRHLWVT